MSALKFLFVIYVAVVAVYAFAMVIGFVAYPLANESIAVHALANRGYTDIVVDGKMTMMVGLIGCSFTDQVKFYAIARDPQTKMPVALTVCAGIFNGGTIHRIL